MGTIGSLLAPIPDRVICAEEGDNLNSRPIPLPSSRHDRDRCRSRLRSARTRRRAPLVVRRARLSPGTARGGPRYALDGTACGEVTPEQQAEATQRLKAM